MLEDALVEGVVSAGGRALRAGVIPTPAVAVLTRTSRRRAGLRHLGVAQPLRGQRHQVPRAGRAQARRRGRGRGRGGAGLAVAGVRAGATASFPTPPRRTSTGSRRPTPPTRPTWRSCSTARTAPRTPSPRRSSRPPARVVRTIGAEPDGRNINAGVGSTHLEAVAGAIRGSGAVAGFAFDGDADRCLAVDLDGRPVNGDSIVAAIALAQRSRPGGRHLDDEPRLPPGHARARDRGGRDRRRRPLRARADACDRRHARRRAVRPRDRPRPSHHRRRDRDRAHAARLARPARHDDGRRRRPRAALPAEAGRRPGRPLGPGRRRPDLAGGARRPRRSWGRTAGWCCGRRAPSRSCG